YEAREGCRAYALRKQRRVADRKINADGFRGQLEQPGIIRRPLRVLVMADEPVLYIADWTPVEHDQERPRRVATFDHVADEAQLLLGLAPPLAHMRLVQPCLQQRIVLRLDLGEGDRVPAIRHRGFRPRCCYWCKRRFRTR